ncbi:MAG: protocatechuate 3,4-dioxygenase [Deltaproteobacteria bacterium]|nr:protocatechuate 3,4-dioxygenase [Deltaproteobacteria bacterium]
MSEIDTNSEKIPGTYVFTGRMSSKGYRLNKFFYSLTKLENRSAFKENLEKFMDRNGLTDWEKQMIREKNWLALAREGGANIYVMMKMGAVTGDTLQHIGAAFRGESLEEFLNSRRVKGAV